MQIDLTNILVAASPDINQRLGFNLIRNHPTGSNGNFVFQSAVHRNSVSVILRSEPAPPRIFYNQDCRTDNLQGKVWRQAPIAESTSALFVAVSN